MSPCVQNKELDVLNAYLHKHKFVCLFVFHFFAQHEAVRIVLFYTSLNNIYPAELNHINCTSHFFLLKAK